MGSPDCVPGRHPRGQGMVYPLTPRPGPFFPPMGHRTPTVGSHEGPPRDAVPGAWQQLPLCREHLGPHDVPGH